MLDGARGRVPTQRIDFVSNGVIGAFAYDLKTAHRYGKEGTASAVRSGYGGLQGIGHHNFVVYGERSTVDDEAGPLRPQPHRRPQGKPPGRGVPGAGVEHHALRQRLRPPFRDCRYREDTRTVGSLTLLSVKIKSQRIIGKLPSGLKRERKYLLLHPVLPIERYVFSGKN